MQRYLTWFSDTSVFLGPDGAEGAAAPKPAVDLSKAFNTDVIIPILANSDVQERLVPFLPEGEELPKTEQHLRETVQSPQFLQVRDHDIHEDCKVFVKIYGRGL